MLTSSGQYCKGQRGEKSGEAELLDRVLELDSFISCIASYDCECQPC